MEPTPEKNLDIIKAPFTPEQVEALNFFQTEFPWHPFTCGGKQHQGGSPVLLVTESGWVCPDQTCDYTQDWALPGMTDKPAMEQHIQWLRQHLPGSV